jgi:proline-specific peptidase
MNAVFQQELEAMPPETRDKILALEKAGLYGKGENYENNRYPEAYMKAAWGEGYFPYLFQNHPDPNFDPAEEGKMSWDLYREMWGSHGEFIIDGNLKSVEYADRLGTLHVPTLIVVGDHDECNPKLSREMNSLIPGSKLTILPKSGHLTFVDQNGLFVRAVGEFLSLRE